jgi:flagellin
MPVINTNLNSLIAQSALTRNNRSLSHAMEQLSTGKRINAASDDAAGLAISNRQTAQIRGLDQAVRNANDAISMIQTAEGATNEITNMLQRMRELSVQAANATYNLSDRASLQLEFGELQSEVKRITNMTEWNGSGILNGTTSEAVYQIGANANQSITVGFGNLVELTGVATAMSTDVTVSTENVITQMDAALGAVDRYRADLGAKINRLTYAADNLTNVSTNSSASRSRILDADYAKASSELARTQIIQQAATAILSQANTSQQTVLKLLQ